MAFVFCDAAPLEVDGELVVLQADRDIGLSENLLRRGDKVSLRQCGNHLLIAFGIFAAGLLIEP
jgi:hypothetical protein